MGRPRRGPADPRAASMRRRKLRARPGRSVRASQATPSRTRRAHGSRAHYHPQRAGRGTRLRRPATSSARCSANLLRNALVHTPAGTPVEVSVEQDDSTVTPERAATTARACRRASQSNPLRSLLAGRGGWRAKRGRAGAGPRGLGDRPARRWWRLTGARSALRNAAEGGRACSSSAPCPSLRPSRPVPRSRPERGLRRLSHLSGLGPRSAQACISMLVSQSNAQRPKRPCQCHCPLANRRNRPSLTLALIALPEPSSCRGPKRLAPHAGPPQGRRGAGAPSRPARRAGAPSAAHSAPGRLGGKSTWGRRPA